MFPFAFYRLTKPFKSKTQRLPKNFVFHRLNYIALVSMPNKFTPSLKAFNDHINSATQMFLCVLAVLAEDAIKAALADYRLKQKDDKETLAEARN